MKMYARPSSLCSSLKQIHHLGLDGDVKRRDRLVADDHLRVERYAAGNADPLPLPAGELMRIAVDVLGVETHQIEQFLNPPAAAALRDHVAMDLKRLADDVSDRLARVQAMCRDPERRSGYLAGAGASRRPSGSRRPPRQM